MESLSGVCVSFGLAGLGHANLPSGEPGFNPCVAPIILEIRARGENIIRFAGAVKEMTSLPAEKSGIIGGYFADIVVFNPDMVIGRATFKDPQRPSSVILWVRNSNKLMPSTCFGQLGFAANHLPKRSPPA